MIKWICRIWWTLNPSVNINTYYRAIEFNNIYVIDLFKVTLVKNAWDKLSKREQEFLFWKCQDIEIYFRTVGIDKATYDYLVANPVHIKV